MPKVNEEYTETPLSGKAIKDWPVDKCVSAMRELDRWLKEGR